MTTPREWLLSHIAGDHQRLLERLRSLDHCLETIFYFGEVCPEKRGLGGLRLRCQELQETLSVHIPAEEKMSDELQGQAEWEPLLGRLREEHRALGKLLGETVQRLDLLASGDPPRQDLRELQEQMRALSAALQDHITTENRTVLRLLAAT